MSTRLHGIDVSNYQAGLQLASTDAQFAIMKATEGTTYVDPYCAGFVNQAKALGIPWGTYHFSSGNNGKAEADFYLDNIADYVGDGIMVLDFERNTGNRSVPEAFLERILDQTKIPPLLYIMGSVVTGGGWSDVAKTFGLWIARWGTNSPGDTGSWDSAALWQYTDAHSTGGMKVDGDYFYGDQAAWTAYATGGAAGDGGGGTEDVWPTQSAIQVPYGTKGSMWASGYHQGDDWHRNAGTAEIGDPIYAVAAGTVIYAGDARSDGGGGWGSAFGKHVLIEWDSHGRTSIDAHMSKITATKGQHVKVGDKIGEKGDTGNVSGPHDHHEQHTGTRWTDPDVKPIYPGKTTAGGGSGEDDDMAKAKHVKMHRTTDQKIKTADKDSFQWLFLDEDDHTSVAMVPSKIVGLVYLQVSGLTPDDSIYLRPGSYDIKKKDSGNVATPVTVNEPDRRQGNSAGWLSESIPVVWDLADQADGQDYRALRFMVASNTKNATIVNCRFEGYVTEK